MMSIGIVTVGGLGVFALQRAALVGNLSAKQNTTAVHVARRWVEMVKRDALQWSQSGAAGLIPTEYLNQAPVDPADVTNWFTPVPGLAVESYAFDYFGSPTRTASSMYYCTNLRLRWVVNQELIRADVRTWWPRSGVPNANIAAFAGCAVGTEVTVTNDLASATPSLRAVYTSTTVRWTPQVQP